MERETNDILILPVSVVGPVDVGRLLREVEALDNFLKQAAIREPGTPVKLPKTGKILDEIIAVNKLNVLLEGERKRLYDFLKEVRAHAPLVHMSFAADPSPLFMQKLVTWFRSEIHPLVLIQLGLQPNIGAGAVMRTTNKYFDLSLKRHFEKQRELLIKKLHGDATATDKAAPAAPSAPAPQAQPAQPAATVAPSQPPAPTPPPAPPVPSSPVEPAQPAGPQPAVPPAVPAAPSVPAAPTAESAAVTPIPVKTTEETPV
jgi:hypothetical protein